MKIMQNKVIKAFTNPSYLFQGLLKRFSRFITDDKLYLSLRHYTAFGKRMNWKHPQTFNEKLQWLKLYDRRPEYTVMVDKVKAKDYVASILGDEFIIPTLGVWDDPDKIDFDVLPDRFVLKCNHNSGTGMYICKDKSKMNVERVKAGLRRGLSENYYLPNREWAYKDVPRRILAEEYIDPTPNVKDLPDYKWYCFNGEPKFCQVILNRTTDETIDFFDIYWVHQVFTGLTPGAKNARVLPPRPANLDIQLKIARELSKDMPFSRIDLYDTGEKTFFGEITFFPLGGFGKFQPNEYNELMGKMIELPGEKRGGVIIKVLSDNSLKIDSPDLPDYKFFCFDGKVKFLFIATDRSKGDHAVCFDFFDEKFNHLPFTQGHPHAKHTPIKPKKFEEMKIVAEQLSKGLPCVRVDLYEINGKILFGELTFAHWGGFMPFDPPEWDAVFGKYIKLPTICQN